jgi:hypothetical protein
VNGRKAAGIKYPAAFASDEVAAKDRNAYLFNCGTVLVNPAASYITT